jgi:hypothetical protein
MANSANVDEIFLARLGRLIVRWNYVESMIRLLLGTLCRDRPTAEILTAHMGSASLCGALQTIGNEFADEHLREHIVHAVAYFDRVREYRNYYAHGIIGAVGGGRGLIQTTSARARMKLHQEIVSNDTLDVAIGYCETLNTYLNHLISSQVFRGKDEHLAAKEFRTLPQKPRLPKRLQKPALFLLAATTSRDAQK